MEVSDPFPGSICLECLRNIEFTYIFLNKCLKSNVTLHQWYENTSSELISQQQSNPIEELTGNVSDSSLNQKSPKPSEKKLLKKKIEFPDGNKIEKDPEWTASSVGTAHITKKAAGSCDLCLKTFYKKRSLENHIKNKHNNDLRKENTLVCSYCGKMIKGNRNLEKHVKTMHEFKERHCPICSKVYKESLIARHIALHSAKTRYLCKSCGKVLKSARNLELHERLHQEGAMFECNICQKRFVNKINYEKHLRVHQGQPPVLHECSLCHLAFRGNHSLKRHKLTHSGIKPYSCHYCLKSFYTAPELKRHVNHHTGKPEHQCPYCDKAFWELTRLRLHIMVHKNIKPHKCRFCTQAFTDRKKLVAHLFSKHQVHSEKGDKSYCDPNTYIPIEKLLEL